MLKRYLIGFSSLMVLIMGCSEKEQLTQDTHGTFHVTVKSDQAAIIVKTKAQPVLTPQDYNIVLENTRAEVLKRWNSIEDMPEQIRMVPGSYKLKAVYGDKENLPLFDKLPSGDEVKFSVQPGVSIPIELNCKPQAAMVTVEFDPTFDVGYSDYEMALKTKGDSLLFTRGNQRRESFFKEGKLVGRMYLETRAEPGKIYTYTYLIKSKINNATHYKLTFKPKVTTGHLGITITTDTSTEEIVISPMISETWLPKAPPTIVASDLYTNGKITTTQDKTRPFSSFTINTKAGVKFLKLKTISSVLVGMGFPADGVDLVGGTDADKLILKNLGLDWSKELDDPALAPNIPHTVPVYVNFERFIANLPTPNGVTTPYPFTIEMEDIYGQTVGENMAFDLEVAPPDIKIIQPIPYYVWAKHAFLPHTTNMDAPKNELKIELSLDGTNWSDPAAELIKIGETNGVKEQQFKIQNLTPAKEYKTRFIYGEHIIAGSTIKTETTPQVPNSEFNTWHLTWRRSVPKYNPWGGSVAQYWDTNNVRTASYTATIFVNQWNSIPAVVYHIKSGGDRAAEIRSVGGTNTGTPNSSGQCYEGGKTSGKLLIGTVTGNGQGAATINKGKPHTSRPKAIEFDYQYLPNPGSKDEWRVIIEMYNGGSTTVVGSGEFTEPHSSNMSGFKRQTVPIIYDPAVKLHATHIYIIFESSTAAIPPITEKRRIVPAYPELSDGDDWTSHWGSALRIDNLKLNY